MNRRAWRATSPICDVCGKRRPTFRHHVIREQVVEREGGNRYDPRNRLFVCRDCHLDEHSGAPAAQRIPLEKLPSCAFEFAAELLGPGKAYNELRRHYAGEDPRLDELLGMTSS